MAEGHGGHPRESQQCAANQGAVMTVDNVRLVVDLPQAVDHFDPGGRELPAGPTL